MEEQAVVLRHLAEHKPVGAPGDRHYAKQEAEYARKAGEISELAGMIRAHLWGDQNTW